MDTKALRRGFGSAAGRTDQIKAYHAACCKAADEIDRLREENKLLEQETKARKDESDEKATDDGERTCQTIVTMICTSAARQTK